MTQETAFAPFPTAQERSERTGEGEDTRDATPTRQSLNPTTSLLRMHWAFVQQRRLAEWSDQ